LLYANKWLRPKNFFINRGNHETDDMNRAYGFEGECKAKYNERYVPRASLTVTSDHFPAHSSCSRKASRRCPWPHSSGKSFSCYMAAYSRMIT
jgi:hypothetical protein